MNIKAEALTGKYAGLDKRGLAVCAKRSLDVVISLLCLILLSPILALTMLAIKIDSRGVLIFKQTRVGKDGSLFTFYKLRTMYVGAEQQKEGLLSRNEATGPLFKIKDDPRITRVGAILRKSSIDELPQLINVLKGDMSLVGPRPPVPSEVAEYSPIEMKRLSVVPGITGLWQVNGRSDTPFEKMVLLDLEYEHTWSFWLDLKILLRTISAVLSGRGAY